MSQLLGPELEQACCFFPFLLEFYFRVFTGVGVIILSRNVVLDRILDMLLLAYFKSA